jgi:uncharacterized membrane protein YhaH (DUF805 family)
VNNLNPIQWALRPLKNYAKFSGRASRAEFWWFFLFAMVIYLVMAFAFGFGATGLAAMGDPTGFGSFGVMGVLIVLYWLALLVPTIAVQIRRLHDINRSGWWIGGFYLLYVIYMVSLFGVMSPAIRAGAAGVAPPPSPVLAVGVGILALVMFAYGIALLVFFCLRGTPGPNRYGEDPYGANVEEVFA